MSVTPMTHSERRAAVKLLFLRQLVEVLGSLPLENSTRSMVMAGLSSNFASAMKVYDRLWESEKDEELAQEAARNLLNLAKTNARLSEMEAQLRSALGKED